MSLNLPDLQVTATSNIKSCYKKIVRLNHTNFTTGSGTARVEAVLPADASMTAIRFVKTVELSGGGITAATLSIGIPGQATRFVNATNVLSAGVGAQVYPTVANIFQLNNLPLGSDITLLFTGVATTGNPTAGEIFVEIEYVR